MKLDIEIAQQARQRPMEQVASDLGIEPADLPYGRDKAKIRISAIEPEGDRSDIILRRLDGAGSVTFSREAEARLARCERLGDSNPQITIDVDGREGVRVFGSATRELLSAGQKL